MTEIQEQMLIELRRVADRLGVDTMTKKEFSKHSPIKAESYNNHFKSWSDAIKLAGLKTTDSSNARKG